MLQGVSYLMAKLEPKRKEEWSRPIRESMTIWLKGQDNITYTEKVISYKQVAPLVCWVQC
jgi:hypothetical protein